MVYEFKLSDIGDGEDEAKILKWMVNEGDGVREDDPVVEVETERAIIEIPSPVGGTVSEIHAEEGETVPVGATVVTLDTEEDGEKNRDEEDVEILDNEGNETVDVDAEGTGKEPVVEGTDDVLASASTRLLAREVGVDIGDVEGSGADGRVVAQDVLRAAKERQEEREAQQGRGGNTEGGEGREAETGTSPSTQTEGGPEAPGDNERVAGPGEDRDENEDGGASEESGRAETHSVDTKTTEETTTFEEGATEERGREAEAQNETEDEDGEGPPTEGEGTDTPSGEAPDTTDERGPSGSKKAEKTEKTGPDDETETPDGVVPYTGLRRTVGEGLRQAADAPLVTHHCVADAERLVEVRERLRGEIGSRLTYTPFLVKACGVALEDHRLLNAELDTEADEIRLHEEVDVSVATETEDGLTFPVVESVGQKGVAEIAAEVAENPGNEDGPLGATFTVYNVGALGGEWTSSLPTHPGTAAVAAGEIRERPRVVGGDVVARQTVPLSLTFDHRVSDETSAARFMNDLMRYLNDPMEMLL